MFLGVKTIQRGRLFSWKEYIEHVKSHQNKDFLSVLKVALEIFNGDLKGYAKIPDEKEVREEQLSPYMTDLLKTCIDTVLYKYMSKKESTLHTQKGDYHADDIAIKVSIEFCLNTNTSNFLFT